MVPVVCLYEVFKVILREKGEDEAMQVVAAMQQGLVVDLESNLVLEAATLGIQERLAFANSIIYAVAKAYGATLWTQDGHFAGKAGVNYIPKN